MPPSTPWPSLGDYSAAIQNPRNCFTDPELSGGRASTNRQGLPSVASGNFAVVYQLQNGTRTLAVRCFSHPVTDQQQRHDILSQHLRRFWHPALVDFAYLAQGIRVRGQWYPVVRMEWIVGKQMHQYIEDHLRHGPVLERLAAQWRGVAAGLRGAHTAHGDLQHGNILVDGQGQIRYAANADAFSALVIYLSLLALHADPTLWTTFNNSENLLLKADDFIHPGQTPVWRRLQGSSDAEVRRLTMALAGFCQGPVADVPDLEAVLQGLPGGALVSPTPGGPVTPPAVVHAPSSFTTISCPACGLPNDTTEIYCQRCAHQLCGNRGCPHCKGNAPAKALYCPQCGKRL